MGCDEAVARHSIRVAYNVGISPELLLAVVYSESSFVKDKHHSLSYVYGLCGVNVKAHPHYATIAKNWRGNVVCGANELSIYLRECNGNVVRALTKYKGVSKLGERQARHTFSIYKELR